MTALLGPLGGLRFACAQLIRFGWLEARSCGFAVALFAGLAASQLLAAAIEVPLWFPVYRYDALLLYGIALTVLFRLTGLETTRDLVVVSGCHLVGLAFELIKVRFGSWSYPEPAVLVIGGVPLYSGFMYAAVGSYVCRAWTLLRLTVTGYRPVATGLGAAAIYANFVTHHWLPDLRWPLAVALVLVTGRAVIHFQVGERRYTMPVALSFALVGFFLWIAENVATRFGAWRYPEQIPDWQPVSVSKFVAWSLLFSGAFALVAGLRRARGPARAGAGGFG